VNAVAEAQAIGPEEMYMNVSGAAVPFKLEVMVFEVFEAMTHFLLTGSEGLRPQHSPGALDFHFY
jgi:hypothetical protein